MHPWLAFICFFRILFGRTLPAEVARFLPEGTKALPPGDDKAAADKTAADKAGADKAKSDKADKTTADKAAAAEPKPEKKSPPLAQHHRDGALALLALLQREG